MEEMKKKSKTTDNAINRKNRNSKTATPVCLIDSQKTSKRR